MKNLIIPLSALLLSSSVLAQVKNHTRMPAQTAAPMLSPSSIQQIERVRQLAATAEEQGLVYSLYFNASTEVDLQSAALTGSGLEAKLKAIVTRIASDLSRGRVLPTSLPDKVTIAAKPFAHKAMVDSYLNGSLSAEQFVTEAIPKHVIYTEAIAVLQKIKSVKAQGLWTDKPAGLAIATVGLKKGGAAPLISYLRKKLDNYGYANNLEGAKFDAELDAAVRSFQASNGLTADGVVGNGTWGVLDKSIDQLITQAVLNVDRTRWLPNQIGTEYIFVNLARQQFKMIQNNTEILNFRTVNGRLDRQTPVMVDVAKQIILNPTWTVPRNIFVKDKLALLRANPNYLAESHMELRSDLTDQIVDPYTVDWNKEAKYLPYTIVQAPGPWNALGFIKFPLTNGFAIYLHDTNARELMNETNRLLSSGCVRLQQPFEVAEKLLDTPSMTADRLRQLTEFNPVQATKPTKYNTKRAVPVYLFYQTVSAVNGKLLSSNDPYDIDKLMYAKMISGN